MAKPDDVGAAAKAGMVLAIALLPAMALPGAFLFALGNMAYNAEWLPLLAAGGCIAIALAAGAAAVLGLGYARTARYVRPVATALVVALLAFSCTFSPGG